MWLMPLMIPLEIISYLIRPISLSVRLFANMVAGHVMLGVPGTFVVGLGGLFFALGAIPLACNPADLRARGAGRAAAGLCVRHSHLHLPQRRHSPGALSGAGENLFHQLSKQRFKSQERTSSWNSKPRR